MLLFNIHQYYGEFLQLIPIVLLIWFAIRRRTPLQRVAPILLDINVLLGLILYFTAGQPVSIWHPIFMLVAIGIAHGISRSDNRSTIIVGWIVVLVLIAVGIRIAAGDFLTEPLLPAVYW